MSENKKWYRFDAGPVSHWGQASEAQAIAYKQMRSKRYPDATHTEVAGEPEDEACSIINVDLVLEACGIEVAEPAKLSLDDFPGCIKGRVESAFADKHDMAVVIDDDCDEKVIKVWDFDFNNVLFTLRMSYATDEHIDQCLRLYVAGYEAGERMGQYHKAAEIKRALEIA